MAAAHPRWAAQPGRLAPRLEKGHQEQLAHQLGSSECHHWGCLPLLVYLLHRLDSLGYRQLECLRLLVCLVYHQGASDLQAEWFPHAEQAAHLGWVGRGELRHLRRALRLLHSGRFEAVSAPPEQEADVSHL